MVQKKREELLYEVVKGKVSRDALIDALRQSWVKIQSVRSTLKDVPAAEQIHMLQALLGVDCDLEPSYTEALLHLPPKINPYTREVLNQLKMKKGLISNTGRTPGTIIRRSLSHFKIIESFDVTVFSNEVGFLKPHPRIFHRASHALGVPLSDILHVGDDAAADIEGAHKAGMHAVLVKEPSDLIKVLEVIQ